MFLQLKVTLQGVQPPIWRRIVLAILADPEHEEHDDIMDWLGESFDPQAFSVDAINAELARQTAKSRGRRRGIAPGAGCRRVRQPADGLAAFAGS